MHVEQLIVEITRKCNLKCTHCLRGNAQNKSMSTDVLHALLKNVESIGTLTIGGGEPSLAIDAMQNLYQELVWSKVSVENVYLVTNGKKASKKLLYWFSQIYSLCHENELSGFAISNDAYHIAQRGFKRNKYDYEAFLYELEYDKNGCYNEYVVDLPQSAIYEHTTETSLNSGNIFARGRAEYGKEEYYLDCLKFNDLHNPSIISGSMYVCYNGDVVGDANMSYNDMKKYSRGNVKDWNGLMQGIKQSTIDNYQWCLKNCELSTSCGEYDVISSQLDNDGSMEYLAV